MECIQACHWRSIESTDFTDQGKQQKALRKKRGKEERNGKRGKIRHSMD